MTDQRDTSSQQWYVIKSTDNMPAYIVTDLKRPHETEIAVLYGRRADVDAERIVASVNGAQSASGGSVEAEGLAELLEHLDSEAEPAPWLHRIEAWSNHVIISDHDQPVHFSQLASGKLTIALRNNMPTILAALRGARSGAGAGEHTAIYPSPEQIRDAIIEECAKVADDRVGPAWMRDGNALNIAKAIRSLKNREPDQEQCSHCKEFYPHPVGLHHTEEECRKNRLSMPNAWPGLAAPLDDKGSVSVPFEVLDTALNYIKHCGANAVMRGQPHPQQWIVDGLTAAMSARNDRRD